MAAMMASLSSAGAGVQEALVTQQLVAARPAVATLAAPAGPSPTCDAVAPGAVRLDIEERRVARDSVLVGCARQAGTVAGNCPTARLHCQHTLPGGPCQCSPPTPAYEKSIKRLVGLHSSPLAPHSALSWSGRRAEAALAAPLPAGGRVVCNQLLLKRAAPAPIDESHRRPPVHLSGQLPPPPAPPPAAPPPPRLGRGAWRRALALLPLAGSKGSKACEVQGRANRRAHRHGATTSRCRQAGHHSQVHQGRIIYTPAGRAASASCTPRAGWAREQLQHPLAPALVTQCARRKQGDLDAAIVQPGGQPPPLQRSAAAASWPRTASVRARASTV